eukprot:CAMPEP_0194243056 /NCGR_PEP_ID=MMETSP0158-20130606/8400_1 /TAXON_ID=33649 /ORGANISM="Thalassionema nitzschioides, Strain L26-B" /LENGTH=463 /DNA_ID=CAMNT_0038978269 /DNA_START=41 /DNA_END=1432 /DNA_ORIENTATION=+
MKIAFVELFSIILFLAGNVVVAAANDNNDEQRIDVRRLRGAPDARKLISESVLSAVRDGAIDPQVMERVIQAGMPRDLVENIAFEAYSKVRNGKASFEQIENDMRNLREQTAEEEMNGGFSYDKPNKSPATTRGHEVGTLSARATTALSKAVLSAIRNKEDKIDPKLMDEAIEAGASRDSIFQALDNALRYKKPASSFQEPSLSFNNEANSVSNRFMEIDEAIEAGIQEAQKIEEQKKELDHNKQKATTRSGTKPELSYRATKALSKAVLSGFRSKEGKVDPKLMDEAIKLGASRDRIFAALGNALQHKNKAMSPFAVHEPNISTEATTPLLKAAIPVHELKISTEATTPVLKDAMPVHELNIHTEATTPMLKATMPVYPREERQTEQTAIERSKSTEPEPSLSYKATKALSKAVLSGYRNEEGKIDQTLMEEAINLGATRGRILKALGNALQHKKQYLQQSD